MRYLLVETYSCVNRYNNNLFTSTNTIGRFDTIEECKVEAENSVRSLAYEYIGGEDPEEWIYGMTPEDYIGEMEFTLDEDDGKRMRLFSARKLMRHEYDNSDTVERVDYTVIRLED